MPPMGCPADIFCGNILCFNGRYMINLVVPLIMSFIFSQQLFFAPFKYIARKKYDISKLYNKFFFARYCSKLKNLYFESLTQNFFIN
jgi:hypothetical protein